MRKTWRKFHGLSGKLITFQHRRIVKVPFIRKIMNSASKVAEIFESAGMSFSRLGAMTMELQHQHTQQQIKTQAGKWGDEEIEMLRAAVLQFGNDIEKICEHMKSKSVAQIRTALKRKAVQQKASSNAKDGAASTPAVGNEQGLSADTAQTPRTSQDQQDPKISAKRLKMDESRNAGAIDTQDNSLFGKSGHVNNSSIIESALDKLKYDSKDSHEIDIEG